MTGIRLNSACTDDALFVGGDHAPVVAGVGVPYRGGGVRAAQGAESAMPLS